MDRSQNTGRQRPDFIDDYLALKKRLLSSLLDGEAGVVDLTPYLYVYNATHGVNFEAWEAYTDGAETPLAGFHVTGGRCFLCGMLKWWGGASSHGARHYQNGILSTALPAEALPHQQVTVTIPFLWNNTFTPSPLGGIDGYLGAMIQCVVTIDGGLEQEQVFNNSYSGRARKASDSSIYIEGVPDGAVLILEGISWAVAPDDSED